MESEVADVDRFHCILFSRATLCLVMVMDYIVSRLSLGKRVVTFPHLWHVTWLVLAA